MGALSRALDRLPPDAFAVVMATGIVAVAADDHGYWRIGDTLAATAAATFAVLAVAVTARILRDPSQHLRDLRDPDVALRSFTFVAACGVIATRWHGQLAVLAPFAAGALASWLVLAPLAADDVRARSRADLRDHAHGAWLLASVGTQGLAIAAADLATHGGARTLVAVGVVAWLLGVLLYTVTAWLIVWRWAADRFSPDEVTPDSWILMGALAIATLGGARVLGVARTAPVQHWAVTLTRPGTLVLWIAASVWIPALLYAELWRLDHRPGSAHYQGVWWSMVFPLGMYATATYATATQLRMPSLRTVSLVFFWVAATVWTVVAVGLLHSGLLRLAGRSRGEPPAVGRYPPRARPRRSGRPTTPTTPTRRTRQRRR